MRTYTRNSPEAAARIVTLLLLADGHVSDTELDVLNRSDLSRELGLAPANLQPVLQALCEDLACCAPSGGAFIDCLDDHVLASLLAEVTDADLQCKLLALANTASRADGHLADGEARLLALLQRQWLGGYLVTASRLGAARV